MTVVQAAMSKAMVKYVEDHQKEIDSDLPPDVDVTRVVGATVPFEALLSGDDLDCGKSKICSIFLSGKCDAIRQAFCSEICSEE